MLSVSMFDGDALSLTLYVSGKRIARHLVCDEEEKHMPGNTAAFCEGLGLPPKLKNQTGWNCCRRSGSGDRAWAVVPGQ